MNTWPALFLGLLNLALIGALPRIFFRPGRLTRQWWLTASPFFASALALFAALGGWTAPQLTLSPAAGAVAVTLHAGSILLIGYTLGTHREPLSLWHQPLDTPRHIVTHGAYARVRHPFYSAFLLALLGSAIAWPHWITALALAAGFAQLDRTAAREEAALAESEFGPLYRAYVSRTGRFWPRTGRRSGVGEIQPAHQVRELGTGADLQLAEDVGEVGADRARGYAELPTDHLVRLPGGDEAGDLRLT